MKKSDKKQQEKTKRRSVTLRLSLPMYQALEHLAAREYRSVTQQVEYIVWQFLQQQGISVPPRGLESADYPSPEPPSSASAP